MTTTMAGETTSETVKLDPKTITTTTGIDETRMIDTKTTSETAKTETINEKMTLGIG